MIIRWPLGCLIFLLTQCNNEKKYHDLVITKQDSLAEQAMVNMAIDSIALMKGMIHTGDLITRTGKDFTSESLRSLNQRNNTYSHCGIASIENDSLFVYHALGGEWNPDQKIRRDPFVLFADPFTNKGIGIFRFNMTDSFNKNVQQVIHQYFREGVMFDMDFDLKTDNRMYCAEFVYKSIEKASSGLLSFTLSHIKDFEFIGVDDIFLHPKCLKKGEIVYK